MLVLCMCTVSVLSTDQKKAHVINLFIVSSKSLTSLKMNIHKSISKCQIID